jgi:hypothetical protein
MFEHRHSISGYPTHQSMPSGGGSSLGATLAPYNPSPPSQQHQPLPASSVTQGEAKQGPPLQPRLALSSQATQTSDSQKASTPMTGVESTNEGDNAASTPDKTRMKISDLLS